MVSVTITVTVNGRRQELAGPVPLLQFLEENRLLHRRIAIGYNGEVVHRSQWEQVVLKDGDVLDVVQMVGGG